MATANALQQWTPLLDVVQDRLVRSVGRRTQNSIAARMTAAGRVLFQDPSYRVSRPKVTAVLDGTTRPQIEEIDVWALALDTTREFLLGFTQDWAQGPDDPTFAAIVTGATRAKIHGLVPPRPPQPALFAELAA